jgi:glycerol-3-phosphate acyltransferase PlsX
LKELKEEKILVCGLPIESVKNKEADIVVSAGNTGALLVISKLNLKMIENIDKPALSALWPNKKGMSVVLDLGCKY